MDARGFAVGNRVAEYGVTVSHAGISFVSPGSNIPHHLAYTNRPTQTTENTMQRIALLLLPALLLGACQEKELTKQQEKLQAQLPADASFTNDGTLLAQGMVVHIADGDTLTVLASNQQQYSIRLQGIDAPERSQPFGKVCKTQLADLAAGQTASVEAFKQDRYGRVVAKVTVNGKDVALEQLRAGCAWHYTAYAKEQNPTDRGTYAAAEQKARSQGIGLWQDAQPEAPWDYRHKK